MSIMERLHKKTSRDYLARMKEDKVACMKIAKNYEKDYWDGDRRYGYGGYNYDGRWEIIAKEFIAHYKLPENAKILDVGCGKGYLLYEFQKLLPNCKIVGFDISRHALENGKEEIKHHLIIKKAQEPYNFQDKEFDLVISFMTLHNLPIPELQLALKEIERVGKNKYITIESYRNEQELFNLQCWALTAESFFSLESWKWLFDHFGYTGDYELMYFE